MQNNHLRFVGIFLLSFATLLLELSLTRVLSVALWYHFGFLVISTALLGFGASGTILSMWKRIREDVSLDRAMTYICTGFAVSAILSFWLMQKIPFAPFSLLSDPWQFLFMPLYFVVIALPFFWSGLGISLLLTRGAEDVNRYYAWDLLGAALGCLAVILVLPMTGGEGAIFVAAAVGAAAGISFAVRNNTKGVIINAALAVVLAWAVVWADQLIPIKITENKSGSRRQLEAEFSGWNTFSKVELFGRYAEEDSAHTDPRAKFFIIDGGTAATGMRKVTDRMRDLEAGIAPTDTMNQRESGLSIVGKDDAHMLVIGSGGGADVFTALEYGAARVTAVEINPLINHTVLKDPFFTPLFNSPKVDLYTDEGRSFVRRSEDKYDAIVANHTITNAAMASGALSLSESYILTKEAFEDYIDQLKDDGTILFTRPEYQIPRLFTTIREIFDDRGMGDPAQHLYAWRHPPREPGDMSFSAGFLMKKTPFTEAEIRQIDRIAGLTEADDRLELLFTPLGTPTHDSLTMAKNTDIDIYRDILNAEDLKAFYKTKDIQLEPATDNKPFFNHRTRWSSISMATISDMFSQEGRGRMALEDRPTSEVTLIVLLLQVALVAALFILLPLIRIPRSGKQIAQSWKFLLYFAGLGLGFILIEIVFIQRFTLYLGQPIYTLASVLGGLLLFTGIGAYLGDRFKATPAASLRGIIPALLAVVAIVAIITPWIFAWTLSWPIAARVIMSLALLAPVGLMLGLPFPVGLRVVNKTAPELVPWAWGVNGFFTVIGSIMSVILGMTFGFTTVIIIAGCCYGVCWLTINSIRQG